VGNHFSTAINDRMIEPMRIVEVPPGNNPSNAC
jgi:hypothetical protein